VVDAFQAERIQAVLPVHGGLKEGGAHGGGRAPL
jgi:hypothetical protein